MSKTTTTNPNPWATPAAPVGDELYDLLDGQHDEQLVRIDENGNVRPVDAPSPTGRSVALHDPHGEFAIGAGGGRRIGAGGGRRIGAGGGRRIGAGHGGR